MTNFERIKNMSVEEMAETLGAGCVECDFEANGDCKKSSCIETYKKWLESEVQK